MDISVVIPFYNGNKYINNILEMLKKNASMAQNISIEAIVVNDSPNIDIKYDKTLVVGYKLNIIVHEKNRGIQQSRITGIKEAKGKYILMLDQDDEIYPNMIVSQYSKIGSNAAILSNGYYEEYNKMRILYSSIKRMKRVNMLSYYFKIGNMIASPGICLIRKEMIPKEWIDNILTKNGADDWMLWVLFLAKGNKFAINQECLYVHKNDGNNTSNNMNQMLESNIEAINIVEKKIGISKELISLYKRRIFMRKNFDGKSKMTKFIYYIKNLDLLLFTIKDKVYK